MRTPLKCTDNAQGVPQIADELDFPYGRIEFTYHLMTNAAGINMMACRLLEENDRAHFMIRRFDRQIETKHWATAHRKRSIRQRAEAGQALWINSRRTQKTTRKKQNQ
ncbi:HipA domain-containing protein [Sulfuriferula sp.]|uniref:HipA domain-containing protein n=1 Tax=Sulfuriferula sp. TaxID=2025307 RepID=UPI00272F5E86|nr:HipA domain-containing protein [Sulfuriferula sp.]MDP2024750.1 HipA domain-containing protein [Sulfuriferula sp.]